MSILSEIKQQKHSLDDLAKLPQSLIMQMAQRKQIMPEMVAPILSRKAEMMEAVAKTKALQSAPQAMAQPTVLESLMAKNATRQAPMQATQQMTEPMEGIAPAGLGQVPQFAGGGIIAFKEGDMVEDDDAEDDVSKYQSYLNKIIETFSPAEDAGLAGLASMAKARTSTPDVQVALAVPSAKTYEMQKSSISQKLPDQEKPEIKEVTKERVEKTEPNEPPKTKEKVTVKATPTKTPKGVPDPLRHPYAGLVAEDAKKYGNDPKVVLKLLNNETGGVKNPETAVSPAGAVGIAQFMPKTAKQYGADPTNPNQASDAMNRHVKHLMRQYGDPQLVAIAYNWGEGNTNRWLRSGADPRRLPKETQNYLDKFMTTALAKGGEVQSYAQGGEINAENYKEKMSRIFGYDPYHGEAVRKYLRGGEVKHFVDGESVNGDPMGTGASEILNVEKKPYGLSELGKWFLRQQGNPEWKIEEEDKKALAEDAKNKAAKPAQPLNPKITTTKAPLVTATPEQREASKTQLERDAELEPTPDVQANPRIHV